MARIDVTLVEALSEMNVMAPQMCILRLSAVHVTVRSRLLLGLWHSQSSMVATSFIYRDQVIFDVLLRKSDLVEKFVAFANKPRLLQRFKERLADYKRFWQGVQVRRVVCRATLERVPQRAREREKSD